jgi:SAM-dependent methyltransferase
MRRFWDEGARRNAAWYVDTSLDYDEPDMDRFFETGRVVVAEALDHRRGPAAGRALAVEIGSGLGRICGALAERFDRVIGVDISPEMVARASRLVTDPRISFIVGSGSTLDGVSEGSADLVLSFTVFQHIPKVKTIERYLLEAGRVLRPGGLFVFQWNNSPGWRRWALRRAVLAALQRTGLRPERFGRNASAFLGSRVPLPRVRRTLERGGMELEATSGTGTLFTWAWARRT